MSSSRRPGGRSRAPPTRKKSRPAAGSPWSLPEPLRGPGLPPRAPLRGANGAPAGERGLAAALPDALARGQRGRTESRDEAARVPHEFVRRLRPGRALHPGRALRDDERGHRPRARHPDRVPEPADADPNAAHRRARGPAWRRHHARPRSGRRLPLGRPADRRAHRVGPARDRRPARLRGLRRARVRRARRIRGAANRLRRGGAGALPGFLRLPVHLVDEHPAQPHGDHVVPGRRHREPGLVPARVRAQPDHHGLGRRGARPRLWDRRRNRGRLARPRLVGPEGADGPVKTLAVARGVAWRTLHNVFTNPSLLIPSIVFPLFFFTAFAGGLSRVRNVPGFDFPQGYTAFQFVFVVLQSAAFGGVFTGFGIARDFESGFSRRLLLAAPHRSGIVIGYALAALCRWFVTVSVLTAVAFAVGMHVGGSGVDLFGLYALAVILNIAAILWACGVAMRLRTMQAGPIMQLPVFLVLFFAPVYVPLSLLQGWIHAVATVNPLTRVIEAGRGFLAGSPTEVGAAFGATVALALGFALWAMRGLRNAEAAG